VKCPACAAGAEHCCEAPKAEATALERPPSYFAPRQRAQTSRAPAERQADFVGQRIGEGLAGAGNIGPGLLPQPARRVAERHLGVSLEGVELRAGAQTDEELRAAGAMGVTEGTRVTLDTRDFSTATAAGRALIGHELTHVAQQRVHGAPAAPQFQERGASDWVEPSLLRESDLQGSPAWCKDSPVSGLLHEGTCYRTVPQRTGPDDCPPGEQLCFDEYGEFIESSADRVSPVESRDADGTCNIGYLTTCGLEHNEEDKVLETLWDQITPW
jgi:hypothetical protein